jgi:hypothetical protein
MPVIYEEETDMVRYPDVHVQLTGRDGNAFAVIGAVAGGLRKARLVDAAKEFTDKAFDSRSYDDLLSLAMAWVDVS